MIERIDHIVLTVKDLEATGDFYHGALGMEVVSFEDDRKALLFGQQKINLHLAGHEFEPKALKPTPGSGDLCFITSVPMAEVQARLDALGIAIIEGPVERTGALGKMLSIYFRDPDQNLLEVANYL